MGDRGEVVENSATILKSLNFLVESELYSLFFGEQNKAICSQLFLLYHSPIAHVALYGMGLSLVLPQLWFVFAFSIKVCMYI